MTEHNWVLVKRIPYKFSYIRLIKCTKCGSEIDQDLDLEKWEKIPCD